MFKVDHEAAMRTGFCMMSRICDWICFEIEECVDPHGGDGAMLDGEDGTLFVMRGLRMEELWISMFAGPGAFAFRAEEWRGLSVGQVDDDIECD
jgi:hypothetical protein